MQMWVEKRDIYWHNDQSVYLHRSVFRCQLNIHRGLLFVWCLLNYHLYCLKE